VCCNLHYFAMSAMNWINDTLFREDELVVLTLKQWHVTALVLGTVFLGFVAGAYSLHVLSRYKRQIHRGFKRQSISAVATSDEIKISVVKRDGSRTRGHTMPMTFLPVASPAGCVGSCLAEVSNGSQHGLLLWGGKGQRNTGSNTYYLETDPWGRAWRKLCRTDHNIDPGALSWCASAGNGPALISFGGELKNGIYIHDLWMWSYSAAEWVKIPFDLSRPHPEARSGASAVIINRECERAHKDGSFILELVIFGGRGSKGCMSDLWSCTLYGDCDTMNVLGLWEQIWSPSDSVEGTHYRPTPRQRHSCVEVDGNLIVLGGCNLLGNTVTSVSDPILTFNFTDRSWSAHNPVGTGQLLGPGLCAFSLSRGKVLVQTKDCTQGLFNDMYIVDMTSVPWSWSQIDLEWRGDWTMVPGMRQEFCAAMISDGSLCIFGGTSSGENGPLITISVEGLSI
jgi:hypothetical protein